MEVKINYKLKRQYYNIRHYYNNNSLTVIMFLVHVTIWYISYLKLSVY